MAKARGSTRVRDPEALAALVRAEELQQQAWRINEEIARLLAPLRDRLSALVLERDRLFYESIAARQTFFQAAKNADPNLDQHRGIRYEKKGEKVYVVWDDTGPHFSTESGAELPQLHPFVRRRSGRRGVDLTFWLG